MTDYPSGGRIDFEIQTERSLTFKLRVPAWCRSYQLTVDQIETRLDAKEQFLSVELSAGSHSVLLKLDDYTEIHCHEIDGKPYLSVTCGPLLMAHDTHFGNPLWKPLPKYARFERCDPKGDAMIKLISEDMTLIDFASAGGIDPEKDTYTVFIPQE